MNASTTPSRAAILTFLALLIVPSPSLAQRAGPVRYATVVEHSVRGELRLPGSVESRRSAVVAAETEGLVVWVGVDEGDMVAAGSPLVRLRRITYETQLRAAEGRLREAQARLKLADSQLRRADRLLADEVISQNEHDDATSEYTAWLARVDQSTADIDVIKLALDRCTVRAPFDGVVTRKRTELGEWMAQGGSVVELVALDALEVRVDVPERWFANLENGVEALVTFEALPDYTVRGRVEEVIPAADSRARSFPIKVRIPNPEYRIGVGMLTRVALPIGEEVRGLIVPKDAVVRQGSREVVYRIGDDDTVEPLTVRSVQGVGGWTVIDGPLAEGERVVTRGNERLRPGQPVEGTAQEYALP